MCFLVDDSTSLSQGSSGSSANLPMWGWDSQVLACNHHQEGRVCSFQLQMKMSVWTVLIPVDKLHRYLLCHSKNRTGDRSWDHSQQADSTWSGPGPCELSGQGDRDDLSLLTLGSQAVKWILLTLEKFLHSPWWTVNSYVNWKQNPCLCDGQCEIDLFYHKCGIKKCRKLFCKVLCMCVITHTKKFLLALC